LSGLEELGPELSEGSRAAVHGVDVGLETRSLLCGVESGPFLEFRIGVVEGTRITLDKEAYIKKLRRDDGEEKDVRHHRRSRTDPGPSRRAEVEWIRLWNMLSCCIRISSSRALTLCSSGWRGKVTSPILEVKMAGGRGYERRLTGSSGV
jgi:hypothetical protein